MVSFGSLSCRRCAVVLAVSLFACVAGAQQTAPVNDLGSAIPEAGELREGLFPEDACDAAKAAGYPCMSPKLAVTFSLPAAAFALGSASLPDLLKRQLDVFGEVLQSKRGSQQTIRIVGHADSTGAEVANLSLSQRRAQAVKSYLVTKGADASMLVIRGVGSNEPLDATQPAAAENRRVTLGR